jgi:fatty acid desaturase
VNQRPVSIDPYAQLKSLITAQGLLERNGWRHARPIAGHITLLLACATGMFLMRDSWWSLFWAPPAALLSGQLGFLAHDAIHNQVFRSSRANYVFGLVLFNLLLGGSRGWWAERHNAHHAHPNRIGGDPDIEGGVVAVTLDEASRAEGFVRFMVRHQVVTIAPLLTLSAVQTAVYSAGHLRRRDLRHRFSEACLVAAHHGAYIAGMMLLFGVWRGLLFAAVHQMLLGVYLGAAFLPNHTGMAMVGPDERIDFLRRQVLTSRNIRASRLADYFYGPLSCQIEHHLFPAMPRYNLRAAAAIVRPYCEGLGIAYHETSAWRAYAEIHDQLRAAARVAARRGLSAAARMGSTAGG